MEDVCTLLHDSGLGHSFWAEAAAYSVETRNLITARRHPGKIPLESFSGKRQDVSHLCAFGAKCWAKIPVVNGHQVTGGSKLDHHSVECRFLGYATGCGNYKVQDISSLRVFVSHDLIFEEGQSHRTTPTVGENNTLMPLFDVLKNLNSDTVDDNKTPDHNCDETNDQTNTSTSEHVENIDHENPDDHQKVTIIPVKSTDKPRRSTRIPQPSKAILQSKEYQRCEGAGQAEGQEWATGRRPQASPAIDGTSVEQSDYIACLSETKASHNIPRSYRHAMATDPDRWMIPMDVEMNTLKTKDTWDLVKPPAGANVMDSMWVYDIKWDGKGNRIKDKARLIGKGYTQQLGVDYNETWAGVTRLESVRITAAIAAKNNLRLWCIDFVGAYLNSLTKEDIYMKQPKGFIEPGLEDHVCKLVHTIYGTMQGTHDWYETLTETYNKLGYTTSRADPCVRYKQEDNDYTITDTYTDDVFGASTTEGEVERRKSEMGRE